MNGSWIEVADYKLTDLLSSAGATIGVIIAGTIFLNFVSSKYTELSTRYRELAGEYRGCGADAPRHGPLQSIIRLYRHRLVLMNRASLAAALALVCFLLSVLVGGLSILHPPERAFKWVGTVGLFLGLLLIGGSISLEIREIMLARHELGDEIADLDDPVRNE